MADRPSIPRYVLYKEPHEDVELAFLHVETIAHRSSLHDWTIRVHAHPDHHQILLLTQGSGTVRLEEGEHEMAAGTVVLVSALTVHGFRFSPGSDGHVLTVSKDLIRVAADDDPDLGDLFAGPGHILAIEPDGSQAVVAATRELAQEFVWSGRARRVAIKANLQRVLVAIARLLRPDGQIGSGIRRHDAEIVVRYRELVEAGFRNRDSIGVLAGRLGLTSGRLNAACRTVVGKSALTLLHDRVIIEAKRQLLYTSMTVGEIASSLGFEDPAYFNRFFVRRDGRSPGRLRKKIADGRSIA